MPPGGGVPPGGQPSGSGPGAYGAGYRPSPSPIPRRTMGGIPPMMGLGVILAGVPGVAMVAYSFLFLVLAALLSGLDDGPFESNGSSDLAGPSIFFLCLGLFWLGSTVYAAAGSRLGRLGMTLCVGGVVLLTLLSSLIAATEAPGAIIGGLIGASPGLYVLYVFWGPPARGMF